MPRLRESSGKTICPSQVHKLAMTAFSLSISPRHVSPNARSHMLSPAHLGILAVMPFLGHDGLLIGHGFTSDKLANMESVLSYLNCHPVTAPANE
jgi:hypothetical protein